MSVATGQIAIRDSHAYVEIRRSPTQPRDLGYPAEIRFGWGRITGAFETELFDVPGFADELRVLGETLKGTASLVDHDSFGLTVLVDKLGHVLADVWIDGPAALKIDADPFEFRLEPGDQTIIPNLHTQALDAFPLRESAARRTATSLPS